MFKNTLLAALPFIFGALFALIGVGLIKAAIQPDDTAAISLGVALFVAGWLLAFALLRRART